MSGRMAGRGRCYLKAVLPPALALVLLLGPVPFPGAAGAAGPSGPAAAAAPGPERVPKVVTLDRLVDRYEPVTLNHEGHVSTAGGCNDCHHQHGSQALTCNECHRIDDAMFKRTASRDRIRPCRECHPVRIQPDRPDRPALKTAYHRACFKCHREIGSIGKDPKGCTETCHPARVAAKP